MRGKKFSIGLRALAILAVTLLVTSTWAATNWREKVLYSFNGGDGDGSWPSGLIFDAAGNLYGTTSRGGAYGYGTVYELTPDGSGGWTEQVLYNFCSQTDCTDGASPSVGLTFDAAGNLYGTTWAGGTGNGRFCSDFTNDPGCGTVFELTPTGGGYWAETVLYNFCPQGGFCTDGEEPNGSLIFDAAGNLYGTTYDGGGVFELSPDQYGGWTEQVLHSFGGDGDGYYPAAGVIFDAAGNLYGTTSYGGYNYYGTAFEMTPSRGGGWTEQVLWSFCNGADGCYPGTGLILDAAGNLYGTNDTTAFELIKPQPGGYWTEQVLHGFGGGSDGLDPSSGLILDAAGNLYGTTVYGGTYNSCVGGTDYYCGTVYELTPTAGGGWTERVLHSFGNGTDGAYAGGGVILDAAGNLYGTTVEGGTGNCDPYGGCGTVFEMTPVYPCAVCSHGVDREVHVLPAEKRDVLEQGGIERQ